MVSRKIAASGNDFAFEGEFQFVQMISAGGAIPVQSLSFMAEAPEGLRALQYRNSWEVSAKHGS